MATELLSCTSHKKLDGTEVKSVWLATHNGRPFFIVLLRQESNKKVWYCAYVGLTEAQARRVKSRLYGEEVFGTVRGVISFVGVDSQNIKTPTKFNTTLNIPVLSHAVGVDFPPGVSARESLENMLIACDLVFKVLEEEPAL